MNAIEESKVPGSNSLRGARPNDLSARLLLWPSPRTARIMGHRQNMNEIVANRVKDSVWEPWKQSATNTSDYFGVKQGSLLKAFKLQFDRGEKLFAQTWALRFVPPVRLAQFMQRPSGKRQAERHVPLRRCDLTCSHE